MLTMEAWRLKMEAWSLTMEAWRLTMEARRLTMVPLGDSHLFDEEQDPDTD